MKSELPVTSSFEVEVAFPKFFFLRVKIFNLVMKGLCALLDLDVKISVKAEIIG